MTVYAARDLGLTLRSLVADLDPLRWRDHKRAQLEASFAAYRVDVERVLGEWSTEHDIDSVYATLQRVQQVVVDKLPTAQDVRARWMEFRDELHPAYEEFADALRGVQLELPAVRPTNYLRTAFHMLAAVLALLFVQFAPWIAVIVIPALLASFFWFLEVMRRVSPKWNDALMVMTRRINHPHERYRVNSSTWFVTALFLLALTHQPIAGSAAVVVLGFGDPAAGFVGRRWGRTKLIHGRSLEGTIAFMVASFFALFAMFLLWYPSINYEVALGVLLIAPVAGAITELLSSRIDDNFAIPMVVGMTLWAFVL